MPSALSHDVSQVGAASPVSVRMLSGRGVTLTVGDGARPRQLKQHLQQEFGIPAPEMELVLGSRVLRDAETLPAAAGPPGGAPLQLTLIRAAPRLRGFLERREFASVNSRASDGSTVLHLAASKGDAPLCFEVLSDGEFDAVNAVDFLGSTALHQAADHRLPEVCAAILGDPRFTAVGAANRNGRTPLHLAALRGDAGTCAAIIGHPCYAAADVGAADVLGSTAADLAESAGHEELSQDLRLAQG